MIWSENPAESMRLSRPTFALFTANCGPPKMKRALVVCSNHAGACELIEHGVNGYRYDPLDVDGLAGVIGELSALSPEEVAAMAERAAQTIAERLDPGKSAARRAEFFARVAAMPAPPAVSDWLGEALSGSQQGFDARALLDRCGLSDLSSALMRRVPGLRVSRQVL